jgi:hypothetical protein
MLKLVQDSSATEVDDPEAEENRISRIVSPSPTRAEFLCRSVLGEHEALQVSTTPGDVPGGSLSRPLGPA